jgi:hypothetical protein
VVSVISIFGCLENKFRNKPDVTCIGFQIGVAELMKVSQSILSNVVKFVTGKIIDKAPLWIHFPGALR